MNWKGTVALTGLTALAGFFATGPPADAPARSPRAATAARAAEASDIEQQAIRLQARTRPAPTYRAPARNPFAFGARRARATAPSGVAAAPRPEVTHDVTEAPLPPPLPAITLSGIARDTVGGVTTVTAILRTSQGLVFVREGDAVGAEYKVGKIGTEAVELISTADGSTRRITF